MLNFRPTSENTRHSPSVTNLILKKPWYKTPSAYWLLPMFIIIAMTSGLSVAVGIQVYLRAVCHKHYSVPLSSGSGNIDECNNADVQALTAKFLAKANLCTAIPAIFVLGPLGTLSDRKGRKKTLLISVTGTILSTLNLLLVWKFLDKVGVNAFLIGSFIDGITGGFYALSEASYAYATDCTHPTRRSVMFGWIQGAMFAGYSFGPTIGGLIVNATNNLLTVYYITIGIYIMLFLFYLLILPESLSKEKLLLNLKRQRELFTINWTRWKKINLLLGWIYSMFRPLALFLPRSQLLKQKQNLSNLNDNDKIPFSATKYSFFLLAIAYALLSSSIMAMSNLYVLYTTLVFNWSIVEQGYFVFVMSGSKVFVLFILYPLIVKFKPNILSLISKSKKRISKLTSKFKRSKDKNLNNNNNNDNNNNIEDPIVLKDDDNKKDDGVIEVIENNDGDDRNEHDNGKDSQNIQNEEKQMKKEFIFEIWVIRLIFLIDAVSHVAYGLAKSSLVFYGVTLIAALGIITTPAIKSLQTNLISPSQIGQLLGGISVIDSILRMTIPPLFDGLYSILVKTSPGSVWHCIAVLLFLGFLVSFGIRPSR